MLFPKVINALLTNERPQSSNKSRKCWINKVKQFLSCRILRAFTTILFIVNAQEEEVVCCLSPNILTLDSSFIVEYLLSVVFPSSTLEALLEARVFRLIYANSPKMLLPFRTWLANSLLDRVFC